MDNKYVNVAVGALRSLDLKTVLEEVSKYRGGDDVDLSRMGQQEQTFTLKLALYCVLVGPIGVKRVIADHPVLQEKKTGPSWTGISIAQAIGNPRVSNATWRKFCYVVAQQLMDADAAREYINTSNQVFKNGALWPMWSMTWKTIENDFIGNTGKKEKDIERFWTPYWQNGRRTTRPWPSLVGSTGNSSATTGGRGGGPGTGSGGGGSDSGGGGGIGVTPAPTGGGNAGAATQGTAKGTSKKSDTKDDSKSGDKSAKQVSKKAKEPVKDTTKSAAEMEAEVSDIVKSTLAGNSAAASLESDI